MLKLRAMRARLYGIRFELLMLSLWCVFILNILFPDNIYRGIAQAIYLPIQLLAALVLFEFRPRIMRLALFFGALLIVGRALDLFFIDSLKEETLLLYLCFFGSIMFEVFRQISHAQMVTTKIVYAAVCGLLLIGYCGYFVFLTIEFHQPGSFSGLGPGDQAINDLFYFSYVTILTIGYGDITPKTWIAKNATVLVGFTGYLYSIVVIALIVGRAHRTPRNAVAPTKKPAPLPARSPQSSSAKKPPEA
ncbi:potassium channel family protein [Desulfovibrio desulfuricans]|uniref:Potassium channel domain-containing protein n=1 Tax=bioreactor metagenome TaxID=1076179 RepID=A0A644TIX6_9ZZZZ|nr:potassium channel family protein [Desulfovibrio desulfuricans]MBD8897254.1 two pore domain potassium channel family protein [Desulfovibrio desulfuricans]MBT9748313.1 ion transporter [Desulfovibrio desulfuricans]MEA4990975.1 potassium channel family protein [Desulfovibrio desulfuricans]UIB01316.1 potassium channel family protein [Desulfovibrio desulfuricans]